VSEAAGAAFLVAQNDMFHLKELNRILGLRGLLPPFTGWGA